jgi:hypothetical protein
LNIYYFITIIKLEVFPKGDYMSVGDVGDISHPQLSSMISKLHSQVKSITSGGHDIGIQALNEKMAQIETIYKTKYPFGHKGLQGQLDDIQKTLLSLKTTKLPSVSKGSPYAKKQASASRPPAAAPRPLADRAKRRDPAKQPSKELPSVYSGSVRPSNAAQHSAATSTVSRADKAWKGSDHPVSQARKKSAKNVKLTSLEHNPTLPKLDQATASKTAKFAGPSLEPKREELEIKEEASAESSGTETPTPSFVKAGTVAQAVIGGEGPSEPPKIDAKPKSLPAPLTRAFHQLLRAIDLSKQDISTTVDKLSTALNEHLPELQKDFDQINWDTLSSKAERRSAFQTIFERAKKELTSSEQPIEFVAPKEVESPTAALRNIVGKIKAENPDLQLPASKLEESERHRVDQSDETLFSPRTETALRGFAERSRTQESLPEESESSDDEDASPRAESASVNREMVKTYVDTHTGKPKDLGQAERDIKQADLTFPRRASLQPKKVEPLVINQEEIDAKQREIEKLYSIEESEEAIPASPSSASAEASDIPEAPALEEEADAEAGNAPPPPAPELGDLDLSAAVGKQGAGASGSLQDEIVSGEHKLKKTTGHPSLKKAPSLGKMDFVSGKKNLKPKNKQAPLAPEPEDTGHLAAIRKGVNLKKVKPTQVGKPGLSPESETKSDAEKPKKTSGVDVLGFNIKLNPNLFKEKPKTDDDDQDSFR